MEQVNGGSNDCLVTSAAGTISSALGIGIAIATGPVGWFAAALMVVGLASGVGGFATC